MEQLSDESDFYGDEETVSALEARVESFNVDQYWRDRGAYGLAVPQRQSASRSPSPQFHNPYAGHPGAWQLSETVDAFLARLPPATTERRDGLDWIFICNPFIERKSKAESDTRHIRGCEDEGPEDKNAQVLTFKSGGEERLEMLGAYMDFARQGGVSTVAATREANKARADAVKDILELAAFTHVTTGKWMLFPEPSAVNDVWEVVARATARNELGIAAKVAPRDPEADPRRDRLVCIYTTDFRDKDDVARVLLSMRKLGLVTSTGRPIYYKPDAYTYLGIGSGNKWDLRASFYDSKEIFSHLSKGR